MIVKSKQKKQTNENRFHRQKHHREAQILVFHAWGIERLQLPKKKRKKTNQPSTSM
jgi:hypothetical protein